MTGRLLALVVGLALVAGCVSLPQGGGVSTRPGDGPAGQSVGTFDYTPSGPRPGSPPVAIVYDFLRAMQAAPQSTAVARKFLTDEARAGWFPERATLIYGSPPLVTGSEGAMRLSLRQTVQLDDRGTWLGQVGDGGDVDYGLQLVRERGEWRISNPPDALLIPQSHFESRYQQYFVYYFDPTGRVLVPEPTYLPFGEQAATLLVRRLQRGPDPRLDGVLRTYVPASNKYVFSVPVTAAGVADVEMPEQLLQLGEEDRQMAFAQLAWTLRQVTGVVSMRVTVDDVPIDVRGAGSPQSVSSWSELDPSIHWASQELFGLREGRAVALSPDAEEVVAGFGATEYALRDVAVDLAGELLAGVTEDGTTVVRAPRGRSTDDPPGPEETEVLYSGSDVLKPSWNVFDELWVVDRTATGAAVTVVSEDGSSRVSAPGLEGEDVTAFVVSRDGSRLVAAVSGRSGDQLVVSRVRRGPGGRVRGMTPATELPLAQRGVDEIRDLAWRSPGTLVVLTAPTPESAQVLLALLDGSPALPDVDTTAEVLRRRAVGLASAPSPGTSVYLGGPGGGLFELAGDGQWVTVEPATPLLAPTYVG
ncbi:MAG TPA: LpqB family beta-propeller domain-containing protein [Nocardioidaceae bacterium]